VNRLSLTTVSLQSPAATNAAPVLAARTLDPLIVRPEAADALTPMPFNPIQFPTSLVPVQTPDRSMPAAELFPIVLLDAPAPPNANPVAPLMMTPMTSLRNWLPITVVPAEAPETKSPAFLLLTTALPGSTLSPCAFESTIPRAFCEITLPVMKLPALLPVAKTP